MPIKKGDSIKLEYEGSYEDGTIFETSSADGKYLEFIVGSQQVIKGIDNAVIGMEKGDEKKIHLTPSEAFGEYTPEAVKKVPRKPEQNMDSLKPGMSFILDMPEKIKLPVKIVDIAEDFIILDLNHPLAGKTLIFKIKVIDIIQN